MARWSGWLGSRKRCRDARQWRDGRTCRGAPVHTGSPAPTTSVVPAWQLSGSPAEAGLTDSGQPSGLVIHARRAGEVATMPQPNSAA
jgi:hypothetical protein